MPHIISNTGIPSLSRNHARQNGVWQTFDGLSYTCKIGNFVYDWVIEANGKVFLAVQSPTPTFSYKSYAVGECDYFGIQFGTGDPKDKDLEKSKLIDPPTNYPDPCLFNANWQGVDGSMISWISNENNTGISTFTTVMLNGVIYDLGKTILTAALNDGFIIALHPLSIPDPSVGEVIFCEYSTKNSINGSVTKRVEKKINDFFVSETDEQSRIQNIISTLENSKNEFKAKYDEIDALLATTFSSSYENATFQTLGMKYAYLVMDNQINAAYGFPISPISMPDNYEWNSVAISIGEKMAAVQIECIEKYGMEAAFRDFILQKKIQRYNGKLLSPCQFALNYRNSFSNDFSKDAKKTILLHLKGTSGISNPRFYSEFTSVNFNPNPLASISLSNGFALFDLKITWTNEQEIKAAIESNSNNIPEKEFTYDISFLESKRFEEPIIDFSSGNQMPNEKVQGQTKVPSGHAVGDTGKTVRGRAKKDDVLMFDNAFLFAELQGNKPVWITADVDVDFYCSVEYREDGQLDKGQLNWKTT